MPESEQGRSAKFKVWTKVGGTTTSKIIERWASHHGNGGFKAEHTEWIEVDKTTFVQAMAEEMNSGFGMSTGWKDITLQCSNKEGGGGFTVDNDTGNPDNDVPQAKTLTGDFGIADYGAPKCDRVAKALVTFRTPKSDNIHWSLDRKFQNNSGVVATQPHPDGGCMAVKLVEVNVTKMVDESCTLRTVAPYDPKEHVTKQHQFVCATPSGHGATSDLSPETRPVPSTHIDEIVVT